MSTKHCRIKLKEYEKLTVLALKLSAKEERIVTNAEVLERLFRLIECEGNLSIDDIVSQISDGHGRFDSAN